MKVFTAASILGLLSAPALGANRDTFEVEEGGVRFKVSRFVDGRPTPYRVYFWDEHLSGSSYRLDTEGHVVYFKAGSEAYHDRMEMDDESLTYSMKMEHPDRRSARTPANHAEGFLPDSDCSICTMTWDAVCGVGLPMFCDKVRRHSLGDDGLDSVELLCGNQEGACAKAKGLCEYVCAPQQGPTCENGVVGIQASNGACCAAGCGQCGGVGCSSFGNALGLDKYDCCATEIVDMGKPCSETHKAPCFIGDGGSDESSDESIDDGTSTCDNGFAGLQASNGACCPVGCGQCGGVGCSSFGNALGLDKHDCCATEIVDMGKPCSETHKAPCFIGDGGSDESSDESIDDSTSMCDNGFAGLQASNGACCPVGCGQCGGVGCSSFGNALGLDKHDCCATEIVDMGKPCSETHKAPCFIGDGGSDESSDESVDDNTSMMCDNGFVGLQASNGACCPVGCGQCGGVGCSSFGNALGLDKHDCCATEIVDMGKSCSEVDQAPCFCDIDHSADAPTDDLREVIMGSEDEDSMEAMDAKCNRSSLTAADLEGLDVYDFDMYIEPLCMVNNQLPNGCNMMGLGQGCRGCYTTCEGALYYIEMHEQEIKEKGEDAIINFCPFSEVMSLDSCRQA